MEIILSKQFKADLEKLKKEDQKLLSKIWELIIDIDDNSYNHLTGKGKPEKLRNNLSGFYSRRINQKHRLYIKCTVLDYYWPPVMAITQINNNIDLSVKEILEV